MDLSQRAEFCHYLFFWNLFTNRQSMRHFLKIITNFPYSQMAVCKNRNTGTGNGMRGTRRMGGILFSGECHQTFWGMSPNILGNVAKHSGECRQTSQEMSSNIPGNVLKHSGECHKTFRGTFFKHSSCSE